MRVAGNVILQSKPTVSTLYSHLTISSSFGFQFTASFSSYLAQKKGFLLNSISGSSLFPISLSPHLRNHCVVDSFMRSLITYSLGRCFSVSSYSVPSLKLYFNNGWPKYGYLRRCLGVALYNRTFASGPILKRQGQKRIRTAWDQNNFVSEIVLDIRSNRDDLESKLTKLAPRLSMSTITKIFQVLSSHGVLALRFFDWIRNNLLKLSRNARVYSLMIDNFGRLDDYENMFLMLKEMSSKNICLTSEAFEYLPVFDLTESSLTESVQKAVDMLNGVGGSCRNSGVYALIEMFTKLNLFEMAKYVVSITEKKEAYFNRMIREKCKRDLVEDAFSLIKEMESAGIAPRINVYNYILGNLCKNSRIEEISLLLERIREAHIKPDGITFEILINSACRSGNFNNVPPLLDQMASEKIETRPEIHFCIIRSMFASDYEAAHKHVTDSCLVCRRGSNMIYSLLAKLQLKKGDVVKVSEVLIEMMGKSLKPDTFIYRKIMKQLDEIQREDLASNIKSLYSTL